MEVRMRVVSLRKGAAALVTSDSMSLRVSLSALKLRILSWVASMPTATACQMRGWNLRWWKMEATQEMPSMYLNEFKARQAG
eukprot:1125199-Rhodomonas_salina.1